MVEPIEYPKGHTVQIEDIRIVERVNVKPFRPSDLSKCPHLSDIDVPEMDEEEVTVLIGANVPEVQVHEESRTGRIGEPYAVRTILGWAMGRTDVYFLKYREEHLDEKLQQLLDLDNVGIGNSGSKAMSQDDRHKHDDPHDSKTSGICKLSLHLQETNRANRIINYRFEMSSVRTKLPTHSMRSRN